MTNTNDSALVMPDARTPGDPGTLGNALPETTPLRSGESGTGGYGSEVSPPPGPTLNLKAKPKRARRDRSVVTVRTVKRYFIHGRGYATEADAWAQVAKTHVHHLQYEAWLRNIWRQSHRDYERFRREWYQSRYPARPGCNCGCRHGRSERGCWFARMEDYRRIARQIIAGIRDKTGELLPQFVVPELVPALPVPSAEQFCGEMLGPFKRWRSANVMDSNWLEDAS